MSTYMYAAHFARHTTLFFRFSHIQSPDIHGFILYLPYLNYPELCTDVNTNFTQIFDLAEKLSTPHLVRQMYRYN